MASLLCYPNLSLLLRHLRFHHSLHPNRFAVQSFPTDLPSGLRNRCSHCGGSSHESFCSDVNFSFFFFFIYFGSVLDDRCGFFLDVRLFGVGIGLWFLICWAAAGVVGLIGCCFGFVDVGWSKIGFVVDWSVALGGFVFLFLYGSSACGFPVLSLLLWWTCGRFHVLVKEGILRCCKNRFFFFGCFWAVDILCWGK